MLLEIDDWRTVGDLRYRFNKCFPNLQLLVFDASGKTEGWEPLPDGCLLADIRRNHEPGVLSIKSWYTCKEVVQLLVQHHGIKVQVSSSVPASRLQNRKLDQLTLQEFNALGEPQMMPARVAGTDSTEELEGW